MPKRKRDDTKTSASASPEPSSNRALNRRKKLCAQRIIAAQKPLLSALRLAAGFERQKHSRRKKGAKSTNNTKAESRLESEYAKLKQLDLPKVAEQHLRKVIAKVKSLRESDAIPESARIIEKGVQDAATLNVQARLFKVDAVRKVVDETIDELKEIVTGSAAIKTTAEESQRVDGDKQKKAKLNQGSDELEEDPFDDDGDLFAAFDARIAAPSSAEEDSEHSLLDGERPPSVEDSESEGDYELDEDEGSDGESAETPLVHDFDSEKEDKVASTLIAPNSSDEESASGSDSQSIPLPKAKRKFREVEKASQSTFLPSLSHATYLSGSDSEASDLDADLAPRKNRRGQKARQKIWEQKFGDKAKHIESQERSKGWDSKRGAVGGSKGWSGERGSKQRPSRGRGPETSGENAIPLGPKKTKRDDTGSLHPSWLAAKAAKEKKLDVKPQGKKVVFD